MEHLYTTWQIIKRIILCLCIILLVVLCAGIGFDKAKASDKEEKEQQVLVNEEDNEEKKKILKTCKMLGIQANKTCKLDKDENNEERNIQLELLYQLLAINQRYLTAMDTLELYEVADVSLS